MSATVRVRVPATSANLGPAFDCAGLALTRYDVLEFAVLASGLEVSVSGVGAEDLPTDESHLVVRAFRAACAELGWAPPGLRVVAENGIPQGRGMGSSAAAVDEMVVEIAAAKKIEVVASDISFGLPASGAPLLKARDASNGVPIQDGDTTVTRVWGSF